MKFLKELRDKNDWTQEELGKKLGESRALVSNFERTDEDREMNSVYGLKLAELTDSQPLVMQWAVNEGLESGEVRFALDRAIKKNEETDYDGAITDPILKDKAELFFRLAADTLDKRFNQANEKQKEEMNRYNRKALGPYPYDYALPFTDSDVQNEVIVNALNDAIKNYFAVYEESYPRVFINAREDVKDEPLTVNEVFDLIDSMESAAMKAKASEKEPTTNEEQRESLRAKAKEALTVNDLVDLVKEKTKPESRDIPRVVLNSQERQSLIENLTVNNSCPLDPGSLKGLSTQELKGLKSSLKVTDYSGRATVGVGQGGKQGPPGIVLNDDDD